jgi:hypothetical protein
VQACAAGYALTYATATDPARTSQETHYVCITKSNRLMLFRETVAVYCENHAEHIDTLCGESVHFLQC